MIIESKIDILCFQEAEIESDFNNDLLNIPGYTLELERNTMKARTGIYISNEVCYTRNLALEGNDSHLVIVDIADGIDINRIINVYRCFNPQGNVTPRDKFKYQLALIKNAVTRKTIILGDFNLDYLKKYDVNYARKNMFEDFENEMSDFNLVQLVKFTTWSRMIGTDLRSSILDHIYVMDPTVISNLTSMFILLNHVNDGLIGLKIFHAISISYF